MLRKHPKLFQDPKIDYPIYDMNLSFADYVQKSTEIIAKTRQDLKYQAEQIIKVNAPFELRPAKPPRYGALLIHGLLDSPFVMRDLGNSLREQGLLVRSIMLPGHSTVPGALLNTQYSEWSQAVEYGVNSLKADVEKIFLIGFSTGASLAICHAAKDPAIAGMILLAPAFKINSPLVFLTQWQHTLRLKWERTKLFVLREEHDYAKYQSVAINAIYQVYQLGLVTQQAPLNTCPAFSILSYEDEIICSQASLYYLQRETHPLNRTLVYSGKPLNFANKQITVRSSANPAKGILNFSHITLPIAPSNSHYGQEGNYCLASHLQKNVKYGAFDKADIIFYDWLHRLDLTRYMYQRLTFNPDFGVIEREMKKFIEECLHT